MQIPYFLVHFPPSIVVTYCVGEQQAGKLVQYNRKMSRRSFASSPVSVVIKSDP